MSAKPTSKSAPYATSEDSPKVQRSSSKIAPAAAPWEKDQSPKMQSKGGDLRKIDHTTRPRISEAAPYGTIDNLSSPGSPSLPKKTAVEAAPYGTSENVPVQRADRYPAPTAAPFGTSADLRTFSKSSSPKNSAPWERDESKYTHKGKGAVNFSSNAPYATE